MQVKSLPIEKQDSERRKRVEAWMDAGYGSCILRELGIAEMVQDCLLHFDGERYRLLAWVVMPNHVHALFEPTGGWTPGKIVASWKTFTGRRISDYLREGGMRKRDIGFVEDANSEIGGPGGGGTRKGGPGGGPVWHREYWDRYIRNEFHLQDMIEYIHQNPVKAGLVPRAQDWPWSSAPGPNVPQTAGSA